MTASNSNAAVLQRMMLSRQRTQHCHPQRGLESPPVSMSPSPDTLSQLLLHPSRDDTGLKHDSLSPVF